MRTFLLTTAGLLAGVVALVLLTDPLGRFGTGLVPPVLSADRDQKAALYRALPAPPEEVLLGSSRSKTLSPACFEQLTTRSAFNFAVNGAGTEDLLAILRFMRAEPAARVRRIYAGVEPEMLQAGGPVHRALETSRALARYAPRGADIPRAASLGAELVGWQVVSAAARSASSFLRSGDSLPEFTLGPRGEQHYPRAEAAMARGTFPEQERVLGSIPGILGRYESFTALDPERVAILRQFVAEARAAGIKIVAFIPPVHPAFARAANPTAWSARSAETVALLKELESGGGVRYVETSGLLAQSADTVQFVDAIHFLAPVAATLAETLTGAPGRCAVQ